VRRVTTRFPAAGARRLSLAGQGFAGYCTLPRKGKLTFRREDMTKKTGGASSEQRAVTARARGETLNPRKQPRQQRAEATVSAIIEAAACSLETHGIEGYTTNAIAERAGASIGWLYQYFPNKTALTRALIAREEGLLLASLSEQLAKATGRDILNGLIRVAVHHQLRRPVLARLLDAEESRLPAGAQTAELDERLAQIFTAALGQELIGQQPRLTQDLFAIIHGMVEVAGAKGEQDESVLVWRVERAVFGYLNAFG
jgi:AcrR family transcriptional regulator